MADASSSNATSGTAPRASVLDPATGARGGDAAAIPFVTVDDDGRFHVHEAAVAHLSLLQGRLAAVAVCGLWRTGKSYLLNLLLQAPQLTPPGDASADARAADADAAGAPEAVGAGEGDASDSASSSASASASAPSRGAVPLFTVGSTVRACTKGIWLSSRPCEVDGRPGQCLFLDTEGLGSTSRSQTYDARVFALALLLSSSFIYNSRGTIDGDAISKLSLVVSLTKHIHTRQHAEEEDSGAEFSNFFPALTWVVRDFAVRLERDGHKISARDYLEGALRPEDDMGGGGGGGSSATNNAVRMMLRNFFPERDCMTLVQPIADDDAKLSRLDAVPFSELRPAFQKQVEVLRRRVLGPGALKAKTLFGKPLSGAMLASLAQAYVDSLNDNKAPTIATAWDRVVESQCQNAVEAALAVYEADMAAHVAGTPDPTSLAAAAADATDADSRGGGGGSGDSSSGFAALHTTEAMFSFHREAKRAAKRRFLSTAVDDADKTPPYRAALADRMRRSFDDRAADNARRSKERCEQLARALFAEHVTPAVEAALDAAAAAKDTAAEHAQSMGDGGGGSDAGGEGGGASGGGAPGSGVERRFARVGEALQLGLAQCVSRYLSQARGPAVHAVLTEALLRDLLPSAARQAVERLGRATGAALRVARAATGEAQARVDLLQARHTAAEAMMAQREEVHAEAMRAQAAQRDTEVAAVQASLDAKAAELARAVRQHDTLLETHERQSARADERAAQLAADLRAATDRARADSEALRDKMAESLALAREVAAAREEQAAAAEEAAAVTAKHGDAAMRLAETEGRATAAERELAAVTETAAMLRERATTAKASVASAREAHEELEYRMGEVKAQLAQAEGDKLALTEEIGQLTGILRQLKHIVERSGKAKLMRGALDARDLGTVDRL